MDIDVPPTSAPMPEYPSPPFCFKSLPAELRFSVIESFGQSLPDHPPDLDTLRSLSLVDRECSRFACSVLWRRVEFHSKSNEQLETFLQHIAPNRRALIREADLGGAYQRAPTDDAGMQAIQQRFMLYMRLVEVLPALSSLDIKALPFTNPILVITAPTLWSTSSSFNSTLRTLSISGYPQPLIDGDTLSLVFNRFPLLSSLSLTLIGPCLNGSFAPSLRRLERLRRLELRNVECVDARLLEGGATWSADIKELVISDCTNLDLDSTIQLIRQLAPTLETLDLLMEHAALPLHPEIPLPTDSDSSLAPPPPSPSSLPLAPLPLPSLHHLSLELSPSPSTALLLALHAPHLTSLTVLHPSPSPEGLAAIVGLVERSPQLMQVRIVVGRETLEGTTQEEVEALVGGCQRRGVKLGWDLLDG
ncbi:hypothetical protein BCR35DRAFT_327162 [Leucosporidium creatinivorum]|uniref:F-box domain-containing protein n=1 Tax=Leucosporidium creatinivorum TaxID=106004 RepID=A0A1Y2D4M0_9BASI|nr:hypothetical protein BCR35DRAFT_327162 [Leucosporidium creatinivorum]